MLLLEFLDSKQYSGSVSYGNVFPVAAKIHSGNKNLLGGKKWNIFDTQWLSQLRVASRFIYLTIIVVCNIFLQYFL